MYFCTFSGVSSSKDIISRNQSCGEKPRYSSWCTLRARACPREKCVRAERSCGTWIRSCLSFFLRCCDETLRKSSRHRVLDFVIEIAVGSWHESRAIAYSRHGRRKRIGKRASTRPRRRDARHSADLDLDDEQSKELGVHVDRVRMQARSIVDINIGSFSF